MENLKILLVGQPNVGKSSLLNALVGPRVMVSNYPGTTVEITRAEKVFDNTKVIFEDTPGIYSISDRSEEEKITEKALFEGEVDGAVVVVDSVSLERGLYMALQVLEAMIPTVLALNFIEDAEGRGIKIDCEKLEKILHIPVIPINPITKKGINKLIDAVLKIKKIPRKTFITGYDDDIEKAIEEISLQIKKSFLPKRFIAIRVLEGDVDFYKYLNDKRVIERVKKELRKHHPKVAEDIAITRYGTASFIVEKVIKVFPIEKEEGFGEKVDRVLLHKIWGPVTTILSLIAIFGILLYLGNLVQAVFMYWSNSLLSYLGIVENSITAIVFVESLTGLVAGVSIAIPYIFLFYLFLGLLEDVGILPRFIVNMNRFLKKIGLPAKSFIPLSLGLGCSAAATPSTRVLSSKKEQFYTASLLSFVPCSSRTAIIMGIIGFYGGITLTISLFATLFFAALIWVFLIKQFFHIESMPLLLELPPYRMPSLKNVLAKSWIRMKSFVYIVIPLLALGGGFYGVLKSWGLTNAVVEPLSPITLWLGLPAVTIIPLFFGFLQKDLTGGMLVSALGTTNISSTLTPLQMYIFGVAATIGIPCINALGTLIKEFGLRKSIGLTIISILYGLLLAGLIWRFFSFF